MNGVVRVGTWNLWGRYGAWKERQEGIATTLRDVAPDLVGLQEVWHTESESQARDVADALELAHVEEFRWPAHPSDGLAVLSRWPLTRRFEVQLPTLGRDDCECWALGADVQHPTGPIRIVVTHLAWRVDDGAVRLAQLRSLVSRLQWMDPIQGPTMLVGDLNAPPDADEIRFLVGKTAGEERRLVFRDAWEVAGDGDGSTWSPANHHVSAERDPATRLDYVLVEWRPDEPGRIRAAETFGTRAVGGTFPSDHFGVAADLEIGRLQ